MAFGSLLFNGISPTLGKGEWTQGSWSCLSKHLQAQTCPVEHWKVAPAWVKAPREPAPVSPYGIYAHPSPCHVWLGLTGHTSAHSAALGHLQSPPGTTWVGVGFWRAAPAGSPGCSNPSQGWLWPWLRVRRLSKGFPSPSAPSPPCTALLCLLQTSPRVPEDSPAPALSPNTILAACSLPHASCSN